MMMFPHETLANDRIGACSDEAQLYFPWLLAASNAFGRLKWSHSDLLAHAFAHLTSKPTVKQLQKCLEEYRANYLIFLYRTNEGDTWGEWNIPTRFLPRYKTADALRSPSPPISALEAFREDAAEARRRQNNTSEDIIRVADFENLPKSVANLESLANISATVPLGIGFGVDGGEGNDKVRRKRDQSSQESSPTGRHRKSLASVRPKKPDPMVGVRNVTRENEIDAEFEVEPADPIDRELALWTYRGTKEKCPDAYSKAPQWVKITLEAEEVKATLSGLHSQTSSTSNSEPRQ
jgi:hypothetical protein